MVYKFAYDKVKVITLSTQNLQYLAHCDGKICGAAASVLTPEMIASDKGPRAIIGIPISREQADVEIARLQEARKDIMKLLSKEEKLEYKRFVEASKPQAMSKEEQAELTKQMNTNKDRASH